MTRITSRISQHDTDPEKWCELLTLADKVEWVNVGSSHDLKWVTMTISEDAEVVFFAPR